MRAIAAGVIVLVSTVNAWGREWTDSTGRYHVEAELQTIEANAVVLTKTDGRTLRVPLEQLSESDRRFATKLQSTSIVEFRNGGSLECTILQTTPTNLTVLYGFSVLRLPRAEITAVKDATETEPARRGTRTTRLPYFKTIIVTTVVQPWASDFRQIPATVIDNGVLRNVPYKSYRAARDYEINIYGDPTAPPGFEIGIRHGLLDDDGAKRACIAFVCSLLGDPADREVVRGLSLEKDKKAHNGLTFEITPPTDPDAYEGWWVSVYDEDALNLSRNDWKVRLPICGVGRGVAG